MKSERIGKPLVRAFTPTAVVWAALLTAAVAVPSHGQEAHPPAEVLKDSFPAQKSYSPYAGRNFPTRVFFGDTHVHTGASMDAGAFGARTGPEEAFRFARGEEITAANGMKVKLVAAARFHRRRRSLRQHGFLPQAVRGRSRASWPIRPASAGTS